MEKHKQREKEKGDCYSSVPFFLQLVESKGPIELHANTHMCQYVWAKQIDVSISNGGMWQTRFGV
jgi:hypothetical protein